MTKPRPFPEVDSPRFRNPRDTASILLVIALLLMAWMAFRTFTLPSQAASLETPVPVTPWPTPVTVLKVGQDGPILVIVATMEPLPTMTSIPTATPSPTVQPCPHALPGEICQMLTATPQPMPTPPGWPVCNITSLPGLICVKPTPSPLPTRSAR